MSLSKYQGCLLRIRRLKSMIDHYTDTCENYKSRGVSERGREILALGRIRMKEELKKLYKELETLKTES